MNQEVFKPIPGYEGIYEVSNLGNVKSYHIYKDGKLLRNRINRGYYRVNLYRDKLITRRVHQLVAEAFLNHKPNGYKLIVDHIDNNPLNNNVDNLQIITARENTTKDRKLKTSKYTGVCWLKRERKWRASIYFNGKTISLGRFKNEKVASAVYQYELEKIKL